MSRRSGRRPDEKRGGGSAAGVQAPAPAPAHVAEQILALQRSAGNHAVARSVIAREPAPTLPQLPGSPGASPLGVLGGGPIMPRPMPAAAEAAVREFVQARKVAWGTRVLEGTLSMPEAVAMVRSGVPASLEGNPQQIESVISEVMGQETPPWTRGKQTAAGATAEIEASIANAFPKPPTSVTLRAGGGTLELSVSGIEYKGKVGGAKVTGKADKEKGSVEVEGGGVTVGAEGSFKGDAFGVTTKIGSVSFGAKLNKENGTWSKWSMSVSVPLTGSGATAATPAAELKETVEKAHAAVGRVVEHLREGGKPTDDVVKKALEDIKPAIEGVQKAADAPKGPAVSVGATASGGAGGWSAGVSLVVTF